VRKSLTLLALLVLSACVSRPVIPILDRNVIASGTLEHHALTDDLFRIDDFWMRVTPDTEFHRWLSQGVDRHVSIRLTTTPGRYGDSREVRILTGTLIHNTAFDAMIVTHVLYVQDPQTRVLSPITFETVDGSTARKWDGYDNGEISVVIRLGKQGG
jgi:hypothetical protein